MKWSTALVLTLVIGWNGVLAEQAFGVRWDATAASSIERDVRFGVSPDMMLNVTAPNSSSLSGFTLERQSDFVFTNLIQPPLLATDTMRVEFWASSLGEPLFTHDPAWFVGLRFRF